MSGAILIAALSGRALAAAARRAGASPHVLDLFGDLDTRRLAVTGRRVAGNLARGFDDGALLAAAEAIGPLPLVYGAGFEDRPALLARLAEGRRLFGNRPETIARLKDPLAFAALAQALDAPHPAVRLTPPADPQGWLVKRIGASGGGHIRPAGPAEVPGTGVYFQRRAEGRRVSALFLADRHRARVLGYSVQWPARRPRRTFRFGGAVGPVPLDPDRDRTIEDLLERLTDAIGLVGLNSADLLLGDDRFALLEINPRPGASLDIFDRREEGPGLFALHVAACDGRLPADWSARDRRPSSGAAACAVVYARRTVVVPEGITWPRWSADRPAAGTRIARGAPLCTVLARAANAAVAREMVERRSELMLGRIERPNLAPGRRAVRPGCGSAAVAS